AGALVVVVRQVGVEGGVGGLAVAVALALAAVAGELGGPHRPGGGEVEVAHVPGAGAGLALVVGPRAVGGGVAADAGAADVAHQTAAAGGAGRRERVGRH